MDGAIIVTDVRSTELQPQTIEHLIILEMMNVRNVLVVQNKVDLADVQVCHSNKEMLQRELANTVAEGAPVVLLSAQSGKGLSRLIVGGAIWSRMASTVKIASIAPAAPSRWPVADLVELMVALPTASPSRRSTAPSSISSPSGVEVPWALM